MTDHLGRSVSPPTYAPEPPMVNPEAFQWSDYGGRCLIFRALPSGELDVILRGEGDEDFHTFRVASPDAPNMMKALIPWAQVQARRT